MSLLISNIVYGQTYSDIFLNYHLPSLLDETNLPKVNKDVSFVFYTDNETKPIIEKHPVMRELLSLSEVEIRDFTWHPTANRWSRRYDLLVNSFRECVLEVVKKDRMLSAWTADIILAKGCLPAMLEKMKDKEIDAVFVQHPRSAFETIKDSLSTDNALHADELWQNCFRNLHPLWVHCHWDNPQFTQYPFTLLWNSGKGLLAHSYSITPIIMRPTKEMAESVKVIDSEVPSMFKNPYWVKDWDEIPLIAAEPITCYYPPFTKGKLTNMRAGEWIRDWSAMLHKSQLQNVKRPIYYPNRRDADIPQETEMQAEMIVRTLTAHAEE